MDAPQDQNNCCKRNLPKEKKEIGLRKQNKYLKQNIGTN